MIQITAYLRDEEDLKRWKEIGNKTAFIHDALRVQSSTLHGTMYPKGETKIPGGKVIVNDSEISKAPDMLTQEARYGAIVINPKELEPPRPKTINAPKEVVEIAQSLNLKKDRNGLCKIHGIPLDGRGRCLQKGCKYA